MTRPVDVWRVCGEPVTDGPGSGCTCTTAPNRWTAQRALNRLNDVKGGPVHTAPRVAGAGIAGRRGS
jgi:hypothetical protein